MHGDIKPLKKLCYPRGPWIFIPEIFIDKPDRIIVILMMPEMLIANIFKFSI